MVDILKLDFGDIYAIKATIVHKNSGYNGPGAFVIKNGDKTLCIGYSGDIARRLSAEDIKNYTLVGKKPVNGLKYTHIEQYLTENNFLAACVAYWLIYRLRPTENREKFIESKWNIRDTHDVYMNSDPDDRFEISKSLADMLSEERICEEFCNS